METETKTKSKHSQNILIILCWLVYIIAYLGRYSYNSNINLIIDDYGVSHAEAGLVTTFFFFAYGIGQVVNGIMCRRYNKKILFPCVLIASSVLNLLILKLPFSLFKYTWLLNGFLQSCLWSSIIDVISTNIDSGNLNKAMILMSTTTVVGTIITYGSSALFVKLGNYRISFILAACVMCTLAVLWLILYKPTGAGVRSDAPGEYSAPSDTGSKLGKFAVLIGALAVFAVMNNFIKDGLSTWVPAILKEKYNMKDEFSILLSLVLPVCGLFGAMVSLRLNRYVRDFVGLNALLFAISAVFIAVITVFTNTNAAVMLICFGIVLCMMHGVNNVITSMAPLKMRAHIDSGKMAGILNGFCYLGSTISSYGLGAIADRGGWHAVFILLLISCCVCIVLGTVYTKFFSARQK